MDKHIADMFFDADDDEEFISKERALSIFKKSPNYDQIYTVKISNMRQFRLCIQYIAISCTFRQATKIFLVTKEETNLGYLGAINKKKVTSYVRVMVAISLQNIKDQLERSWCYSVAFDGSTHQSTSYFDIRLRVFVDGEIKNVHLIALPMFERHTGAYMYELFKTFFDVLDESWTTKVIGVTTDGAANMTGCHRGIVTMIQNAALYKGFYCIWCALHQLDIVVQNCVTNYFKDDFYGTLTGLIG